MFEPADVLAALGLPTAVSAIRQRGYDATVWRADLADGSTVAIRLLRAGVAAEPDIAALRLAARHTPLAPRLLASGHCAGRAAVVLSWCPGRPIADLLGAGDDARHLGTVFGAAQRELHRPVEEAVLCHLDYQPFNVLAADGEITGIVDWANARLDDPRADLAWTAVVLALAAVLVPGLGAAVDEFAAGWRGGYGGVPGEDELRPFLAEAARRQRAEWEQRGDGCPPAVLTAVRALDERYRM